MVCSTSATSVTTSNEPVVGFSFASTSGTSEGVGGFIRLSSAPAAGSCSLTAPTITGHMANTSKGSDWLGPPAAGGKNGDRMQRPG